ncbi:phenylalanine--tRNA ligase subunit beta [Rickettsiales endosymbiont of Stachyamoeba lipophora]|uniref:phenylalanine--tRNA ligase subunit beta n=1 Tax=Rickettsiales endosymbiont of Stachyamoeba lipophora TaxID=2486578 RepID=UPI000F6481B6|nr:phenylalanine--tRNA ligase subunit beta [Rickettsiales endosymbiont of Stachyamoeba lipophora]AZL15589.1 phenylalanine--tRNA ligase subunit beta [Rickettsiales endosymbiont of Stachyamoeba lipophora]
MRFTLSWLKKFLDTEADIQAICDGLVKLGLEVEEVEDLTSTHHYFKIAEIQEAKPHPNADSLRVCKVFDGEKILDIVCGAPNARAGIKVALAPIDAIIPSNNLKIKESKIRGELSQGMLCSASELGLGTDSDGIIELDTQAPIGSRFIDYQGLNDPVIEVEVTPNRPDCLGVYGIARDLSALGLGNLKPLEINEIKGSYESPIKVTIEDTEICKHFVGRYIKNIQNTQSPKWLGNLLTRIGMKPISAIVDITNYINLSFARPLHAFDSAKLNGNITVRKAKDGENFTSLDDKTYNLTSLVTVVADSKASQAIAGVIGGKDSGCELNTTAIFLESAYFPPLTVINSGRALNIHSDSRFRFERGIDPLSGEFGSLLATQLILEICGGEASLPVTAGQAEINLPIITIDAKFIESKLGLAVNKEQIIEVFSKLNCEYEVSGESLAITPPSYRRDLTIKEDLVEEVARVIGYDSIPLNPLPMLNDNFGKVLDTQTKYHYQFKRLLASIGFDEVVSWSFMNSAISNIFGIQDEIELANPISSELNVMRKTIVPNLLKIIKSNENRSIFDQSIFELGPIFLGTTPEAQPKVLAGIRAGLVNKNHYLGQHKYNWLDSKTDLFTLLEHVSLANKVKIEADKLPAYYHPSKSGRITLGKKTLGYFGEIHPKIAKQLDIRQNLALFELFLEEIPYPKSKAGYKGQITLNDYQKIERRFSLITNKDLNSSDLIVAIKNVEKNLIKDVSIFDYMENLKGLSEHQKVLGFSVTIQADNYTLTTDEIDIISNKIIDTCSKLDATLRA